MWGLLILLWEGWVEVVVLKLWVLLRVVVFFGFFDCGVNCFCVGLVSVVVGCLEG